MENPFKKNPATKILILLCLIGIAVILFVASRSEAQVRGYEFSLNGRTFTTNPNTMSGPGGCRSNLLNIETGRLVCPGDAVASPSSVWQLHVAQECGMARADLANGRTESTCIGGFVAVGRDCLRVPQNCRYFRISQPHDERERWSVSVVRIHQLGRELWIARPGSQHWSLFARCHAGQYAQYPDNRYTC